MSDSSQPIHRHLIAVVGKGGVGKTAFTALMTTILVRNRYKARILAIDADPATGLPIALGVDVRRNMGEVRDEIIKTARTAKNERKVELANMLDYMVFETLIELDGYSLIAMGRSEADGCFCPVNDLLRAAIEDLSSSFDIVLIDGEAGLEQINRKVMRNVDTLITVTDLSVRGFQAANTIKKIADSGKVVKCKKLGLVVNRVKPGEEELASKSAKETGLELLGFVPEDENLARYDSTGQPLLEIANTSPSIVAVAEVLRKLELVQIK